MNEILRVSRLCLAVSLLVYVCVWPLTFIMSVMRLQMSGTSAISAEGVGSHYVTMTPPEMSEELGQLKI